MRCFSAANSFLHRFNAFASVLNISVYTHTPRVGGREGDERARARERECVCESERESVCV